ncbi:MAG: tyrosine-type recombinase/integrase [Terriglobales bacterium]|jgi:integrase
MTLFRRGNIFWAYVYIDGVRHAKSTGTNNRRQAELIEQRFKDELNLKREGLSQLAPETTFSELAARFLAEAQVRPFHLDRLKVLLPYFGETPIGRITKNLAIAFRRHRHSEKQITDTTVNRDLECLRSMLFWAVDEGLISTNPLSRVRMTRERKKPRFVISVGEEDLLLPSAAPHLRSIIITALDTGMRRGEILTQRWEHIDFNRRILSVTHSKTPEGEAREIPLTARLAAFLESQRKEEGPVFTFKGQPIRKIKTAWMAAIRRAGIRYYRFHDLRHAFNCRMMEAGVLQEVRKALMGHSSGEDVHSTYVHVELPMKRAAVQKLEEWTAAQRKQLYEKGGEHEPTRPPADDRKPAASLAGALPPASHEPARAIGRGCRVLRRRESPGSARSTVGS